MVAAAIVLGCNAIQWAILLGCVGAVLAAELFNSALETLFRGLDDATKARTYGALDVSAGAVLLVSVFASVVGTIVFVHKVAALLGSAG